MWGFQLNVDRMVQMIGDDLAAWTFKRERRFDAERDVGG